MTVKDSAENLITALRWRYAVKKFDPTRIISDTVWNTLEEALILTPSSYGLQPWKFVVVDDLETRFRLRAASYGQPQITDAARLVVLAARKSFPASEVERHVGRVAEVRGITPASLGGYRKMMMGLLARSESARDDWAARQVYIALGNLLTSAASLGVDACPMEGIESAEYDRILGLGDRDYTALVAVPLGYRSPEDANARIPKVRFEKSDVLEYV